MDELNIVKQTVDELVAFITSDFTSEVTYNESEEKYLVILKSHNEAGLMIGNRGKGIDSLQTIVSLILRNKLGKWINITLDIAGWKKREEDRLKSLADQSVERAIETGEMQALYNLTPSQRRTVHMYLSERTDIKTESVGEGVDRYLTIIPQK